MTWVQALDTIPWGQLKDIREAIGFILRKLDALQSQEEV